jgi:hypothetical protein
MNEQQRAVVQQALGALVRAEEIYGQPNSDIQAALRQLLEEAQVQEPSFGGVVFAVEEAIRNGDCPFSIEIAFEAYESERIAMLSAAPTSDKLTPIQKKETK